MATPTQIVNLKGRKTGKLSGNGATKYGENVVYVTFVESANDDLRCYDFLISAGGIAVSLIPTARK